MQAYDQQLQQLDPEIARPLKDLLPILKRMQKAVSPQSSAH
jgi:hypothetical protein